jgi:hypothetical protein
VVLIVIRGGLGLDREPDPFLVFFVEVVEAVEGVGGADFVQDLGRAK